MVLEPKKIKSDTVSPSISHEVMGPDAVWDKVMEPLGGDYFVIVARCLFVFKSVTSWTVARQPGSSVYGIFQARILEWVAIFFSRGSS